MYKRILDVRLYTGNCLKCKKCTVSVRINESSCIIGGRITLLRDKCYVCIMSLRSKVGLRVTVPDRHSVYSKNVFLTVKKRPVKMH